MKNRVAASVALAAALVGGLAGCNLISPQSTTIQYDASDGVGVDLGDIELRNFIILVDGEEGPVTTSGSILGTIVNEHGVTGTVTMESAGASATLSISPDGTLTKIGFADGERVMFEGTDLEDGGTIEVTFTGPDGTQQTAFVPILDGTLLEYSTLVPTVPAETTPPATQVPPADDASIEGDASVEGDASIDADATGEEAPQG